MIIQAKRLTCRTFLRIIFIGFLASLLPCMVLGAIVTYPFDGFSFAINDEPLVGGQRFFALMFVSGIFYLVSTILMTAGLLIGVWLHSYFGVLEFEFIDAELIAPRPNPPGHIVTPDDIRIEDYLPDDYEERPS